jgi:FMN phosphatase YigB (HAD superfamily)
MASLAVVFDFDHSFIEECSDLFVLQHCGAPGLRALEYIRDELKPGQWNDAMITAADMLFRDGVSKECIQRAAHSIPVYPQHIAIARLCRRLGFALHMVSDANEVWIRELLKGA